MKISNFLFKTSDIQRSSYFWNTVAGSLNAAQSVILLIIITRTNGLYDAGVFSIAYAIANLTLTIGKYGMRSYQATDIKEQSLFCDYLSSRLITCIGMIVASLLYCIYGLCFQGYTSDKVIVVFLICLWKTIDAIEDVFHGEFQQKSRLDVAAKAISIRLVLSLIAYCACLFITHDLIFATSVCCMISFICFATITLPLEKNFSAIRIRFKWIIIKKLLIDNFPLCAGGFFLMYIGNAPKYAIDAYLPEEMQAYYNFIFMPVFVVELLANFVFNPVLTNLAKSRVENNKILFKRMLKKQIAVIGGITAVVLVATYLIGVPLLSWLYATNLIDYKYELCILLLGGGFLGLVSFFSVAVTVLRKQKKLLVGYVSVVLLAKIMSTYFVTNYQIMGSACLYTILMLLLAMWFGVLLIIELKKEFN